MTTKLLQFIIQINRVVFCCFSYEIIIIYIILLNYKCVFSEMIFAVVESRDIKNQRELSVVPLSWIHGDLCFWPDAKASKHAKRQSQPAKIWSTFKYQILKTNIGKITKLIIIITN